MVSETRRLAMRRAHTKHKGFCTCGKIVSGNGAIHMHREMHRRRGDGHWYMVASLWEDVQAGRAPMPAPRIKGEDL